MGGMTLAVPGATGFVALTQRAVIKHVSRRVCRPSAVPVAERLPIVPATRGLRKNPGGPSSRMPRAAFTGTGAGSNGDVARLTSLVLGRSKAESSGLVFTTERGTAVDRRNALRAIRTAAKALGMSGVACTR